MEIALQSDILCDGQYPIYYPQSSSRPNKPLNVLSLFSGCGGMDIGFEGDFICHKKSIKEDSGWIDYAINEDWVKVKSTLFKIVFANDIMKEAQLSWLSYMRTFGYDETVYHLDSIVNIVKMHEAGAQVFPANVDVVTGGFPCQDFSVAGKRKGFNSNKNHDGSLRESDEPSEETRGKLYYWMKKVVDITKPKIFIAENVKGLVNLGDVKHIIQSDFSSAGENGYYVFEPQILHAGNFGVPETRERVIFIGVRKDALNDDIKKQLLQGSLPKELSLYPHPTHSYTLCDGGLLPPVICKDVFDKLLEPENSKDLSQIYYSKAKYMGSHCQGQKEISLYGLGPTIRSEHHGNIEYRRLSEEHGGVYSEELSQGLKERRLTPRECALIQTFPPDYFFVRKNSYTSNFIVSPSNAYKIIGNAVPPVLAYNIAMRIQSLWNKYFKS